jgi:hypothetical protein
MKLPALRLPKTQNKMSLPPKNARLKGFLKTFSHTTQIIQKIENKRSSAHL